MNASMVKVWRLLHWQREIEHSNAGPATWVPGNGMRCDSDQTCTICATRPGQFGERKYFGGTVTRIPSF